MAKHNSQGNLNIIPVPFPQLEEQKGIVTAIENNFEKTQLLKTHITANQKAVEELLLAIMHKAFEYKVEMEIG